MTLHTMPALSLRRGKVVCRSGTVPCYSPTALMNLPQTVSLTQVVHTMESDSHKAHIQYAHGIGGRDLGPCKLHENIYSQVALLGQRSRWAVPPQSGHSPRGDSDRCIPRAVTSPNSPRKLSGHV